MHKHVKVIGIGSPFGQDRAGIEVVERLSSGQSWASLPLSLAFVVLDRPGPALIPLLADADLVVLTDALAPGSSMQEIQRINLEELALNDARPSSHSFGVAETLALARAMGMLPPELWIYPLPAMPVASLALSLEQQLGQDLRLWCGVA